MKSYKHRINVNTCLANLALNMYWAMIFIILKVSFPPSFLLPPSQAESEPRQSSYRATGWSPLRQGWRERQDVFLSSLCLAAAPLLSSLVQGFIHLSCPPPAHFFFLASHPWPLCLAHLLLHVASIWLLWNPHNENKENLTLAVISDQRCSHFLFLFLAPTRCWAEELGAELTLNLCLAGTELWGLWVPWNYMNWVRSKQTVTS